MFHNIPHEMRAYAQWVLWKYEDLEAKKPTKVPYSARTHRLASVTDPESWATYEQTLEVFRSGLYSGIGFVLAETDPYAFIDLDDTQGDAELMERQLKVFREFDSYAERSPSGKGLHIIVKGKVESGRRRSFIEVYSSQRYMTMTGDVYRDSPIRDCNDMLQVLWGQMSAGKSAGAFYAGLDECKETDEVIVQQASKAINGEKFTKLLRGEWHEYYQSQSEADFAFIDIVAFYTQNRAQIMRIFGASGLGQRDKAKRKDYINYMVNKSFDRMLPPVDLDGLRNQLNEFLEKRTAEELKTKKTKSKPIKAETFSEQESIYSVPPGIVGSIAQFFYSASPRPVPEIALVGALGLMAGIVGRSYNISGLGLNQYFLLLAATGVGKEAMASGIDKLMQQIVKTAITANEFIGPAEMSSAPAIAKYMSNVSLSFVSVLGEFGLRMNEMCNEQAPAHMVGLRRTLLDFYNKSGEGKTVRPSIWSDPSKNTLALDAPALTLLGESTPEKFYEVLNESMISEGLLPRFTIIEYQGDRADLNEKHGEAKPSFELVERMQELCAHSAQLNQANKAVKVAMDSNAEALFKEFNLHADQNIRGSKEIRRQLWNRAHVKAMKLAALVAVGCDPYNPIISYDVALWAIKIIVADVRNITSKFDAGEIGAGSDETKQLLEVIRVMKDYVTKPWSECEKYAQSPAILHSERIIPMSYVQRRLVAAACFRKDRLGSTVALKRAFQMLVDRGDIQEVARPELVKKFNVTAKCFIISSPRVFGL